MKRTLLLLLTCVSTLTLHASLATVAERPIAPPSFGEQPGFQRPLAGATDDTNTLVLWVDTANDRNALYAVLVDAFGVRKSATLIDVSQSIWGAEVVWTGSAYLVAWSSGDVHTVLLDRDGRMQSAPETIGHDASVSGIAWSGSRAIVSFIGFDGLGSHLTAIEASGHVTGDVLLANRYAYTVLGVQDGFVAIVAQTLASTRVFRAVHVSEDLQLSPSKDIAEVGLFARVHAASNGEDVGIELVNDDLTRQRFTIDGDTLAIDVARTPEHFSWTVVATPDGDFASVGISDPMPGTTTRSLLVTPFDASMARAIPLNTNSVNDLLVTPSPRGFLGVWTAAGAVTYGAELDASLAIRTGDIRTLSVGAQPQTAPAIVTSGDRTLITWSSCNEEELCTVRAVRLDRDDHALDAQPLVVATHADVKSKIAASFAGQVWVLAWQDGDGFDSVIKISRIGDDGAVLDATPIAIGNGTEPALSSNPTSTVLVYTGVLRNAQPNGVAALLIAPDGSFLMPEGAHTIAEGVVREPAIATNGTEFMVVFSGISGFGIHIGYTAGIFGVRLDANGEAIAQPFSIADAELEEQAPSIVASSEDYLVAYALVEHLTIVDPPIEPIPQAHSFVFAKRVLHTGVLAGTTFDQPGQFLGEGTAPVLVANGARTGVFFRNVPSFYTQAQTQLALFGTQIDANAMPVEDARLLMLGESYAPDFAASLMRDGAYRLAFSRVTSDAQFGRTQRVFLRTVADVGARRRPSRR